MNFGCCVPGRRLGDQDPQPGWVSQMAKSFSQSAKELNRRTRTWGAGEVARGTGELGPRSRHGGIPA